MTTSISSVENDLYAEYQTEILDYRRAFSRDPAYRNAAYVAIVLVLLGCGLDYELYPQFQLLFGEARVAVAILIFCFIMVMRSRWGVGRTQWLTFLWLLFPQIMIAWMISKTEGANSLYCEGLHLAIFAACIALPFNLGESITFCALTFLMYVIACSGHADSFHLYGPFAVNAIFLFMSSVVGAVCTFINDRGRVTSFRLKSEVAQKNRQLEEINRSLAQIKGQMLQQEKMAAIGTLAGGLLHEVNNPVNFCLMAIDLAIEEPVSQSSATLSECLSDAKEGMQRVQNIVSDLKIFAYRKPDAEAQGQPFLFEKALNSAERLTGHELRGIRVTRDLPADTLVHGDEAAIIGVLINLLSNATIAMRKGSTREPAIHVAAVWHGPRLFVSVRDNGPGIPKENLTRVFEPFFTTREIGQGLGLGLSICYSVIERHGGILAAASVVGEWTEMTFDLPHEE
ncbi:MAG: ATP-binding protein [Burkholderiaceae bacterium]|nr:ATP-binding protein [Burkholderiaceae bacterium]